MKTPLKYKIDIVYIVPAFVANPIDLISSLLDLLSRFFQIFLALSQLALQVILVSVSKLVIH